MELTISDLKPFLPGLEAALDDEAVSEVMINGPGMAFVERDGRMAVVDVPQLPPEAAVRAAVQIARGSAKTRTRSRSSTRVWPTVPASPSAARWRRRQPGSPSAASAAGPSPSTVDRERVACRRRCGRGRGRARPRANLLISGGTGSGKTMLLNALVSLLPADGRIISIEDTLELRLRRA